jgi:hypothetical protein
VSNTSALYEPLIERDLAAIPAAARAFAQEHSAEELWIAVARFAVLAYAPSQHAKRAVLACRAAYDVREQLGDRWLEMIVECARYAAESRPPWSEPPILDPPRVDELIDLHAAIAANDRLAAEHWLASHLDEAPEELRFLARGDALLMLDAAVALERVLGEKGRYALLRMVMAELLTPVEDVTEPIEVLIDRAIAEKGSIESVTRVFIAAAATASLPRLRVMTTPHPPSAPSPLTRGEGCSFPTSREIHVSGQALPPTYDLARAPIQVAFSLSQPHRDGEKVAKPDEGRSGNACAPYPLARDYAQTLIAHAIAHTLPARANEFLAAVHHNLEHGESFAEWSFA